MVRKKERAERGDSAGKVEVSVTSCAQSCRDWTASTAGASGMRLYSFASAAGGGEVQLAESTSVSNQLMSQMALRLRDTH